MADIPQHLHGLGRLLIPAKHALPVSVCVCVRAHLRADLVDPFRAIKKFIPLARDRTAVAAAAAVAAK